MPLDRLPEVARQGCAGRPGEEAGGTGKSRDGSERTTQPRNSRVNALQPEHPGEAGGDHVSSPLEVAQKPVQGWLFSGPPIP